MVKICTLTITIVELQMEILLVFIPQALTNLTKCGPRLVNSNFFLPLFKELLRFKHLFSVRETSFIDCVLDQLEDMITSEEIAEAGTMNFTT